MFVLSTNISGEQVARAMYIDEGETARFFGELADLVKLEDDLQNLGAAIADNAEVHAAAAFLIALAGAIEEAQA